MPPSNRKRTSTSYESDDGFVDDDDDHKPSTKKVKTEKAASKLKKAPAKPTEAGAEVAGGGALDSHGDEFWELTSNRPVVVSRFGGKVMVSVREYYEKDGQSLPGKKGISMPIAQFGSLIALLPHIETVLKSKGETLPRPEYDKVQSGVGGGGGKEDEEAEVTDEDDAQGKKNFEATSEEEE
ncbi:hypothetical protein MMC17_009585 [Xylographa soralifera]|nr:hypothetical protein [Xylographa soralifera]